MKDYYGNEEFYNKRSIDSDLYYAFEYNNQDNLDIEDIKKVLAVIYGENDGADWHWIAKLNNGKYAYLNGSCDYTGWDCRSGLSSTICDTLKEAVLLVPEKEEYYDRGNLRETIRLQLKGKLPKGVNHVVMK